MFLEFSFYHELVKYVCQLKNKNNRSLSKIQSRETVHRKVISTYIYWSGEGRKPNELSIVDILIFLYFLFVQEESRTDCV